MKKLFVVLLALALVVAFAACAPQGAGQPENNDAEQAENNESQVTEPTELIVFAAASMTETMDQIIEAYKAVEPHVHITATYDSSGTLKTQIEEGADCDLFISAAQKQMNQLDAAKGDDVNPDHLDFVLSDSRINLLENKVALVVPEGNPANIASFADIADCQMIALGNSDVPVGSYSLEILEYLGLNVADMEAKQQITYGTNVKEVTTQVSEGTVDCGIVYATDAFSAGLEVVDTATSDMCSQVIYPAAVLKASANPEAAQNFLDYLQSDEAAAIFQSVGFVMAE
ncbi:MAG: molybdate ABC transporter substrate-binding protein [Firmicutes bacterium]|nr:molybdate ABC transporter substrate-binding protein [Bacillota bacterium]